MPNVLVVFCSRLGSTEQLAMQAAVGAVQARCLIRLRWLAETASPEMIDSQPDWAEARQRMQRDYIAPREVDLEWADGLILCSPAAVGAESVQWQEFFRLANKSRPRVGAVIGDPSLEAALQGFGVECVASGQQAGAVGNSVGQLLSSLSAS